MDSFEFSKIAGAVLSALLVIVGAKTFIEFNFSHQGDDQEAVGYVLDEGEGGETAKAAAKEGLSAASNEGAAKKSPEEFDAAKVVALVASTKAADGQKLFKKCQGCHTSQQGKGAKVGPNLWGVVDRPKASFAGFEYSPAMRSKGGKWTVEELANFLHKPRAFVPKTKMTFKGFKKNDDLAKILAYLSSLK